MKALSTRLLAAASLSLACAICVADDRPYTEGAVTEVSYIRTKPGMFDEYMKWVATQRKQEMEEMKKATDVFREVMKSMMSAPVGAAGGKGGR